MSAERKHCLRLCLVRVTIGYLLLTLLVLGGIWLRLRPPAPRVALPNENALALGSAARSTPLTLTMVPPVELDGLTRDEVYAMRREAVLRHPDLLAVDYTPADVVFGEIVDGLPWWGMEGQFYQGSGDRSITGPSEEARLLLNPYLLLHSEFWGFSHFYFGQFAWDEDAIATADLTDPAFPFAPAPDEVVWNAQAAQVNIHYDVSGFLERINPYLERPLDAVDDGLFDLAGYNARDFNLNVIWIDSDESENIADEYVPVTEPVWLPHYIHQGGSCGYSGGCNNMSPAFPPTDSLRLTGLPARLVIKLWRDMPASSGAEADMRVIVTYE